MQFSDNTEAAFKREEERFSACTSVSHGTQWEGPSLYTEAMKALDESEARYCRRAVIEYSIIAAGIVSLAAVAFSLTFSL